ncbi:hypothetical protein BV25DRAFT_1618463 [Artomyces pyxidatus]|uniref:Uncharacterized protein n=1 Tax=Artomyces pyxidatus TaxID=48021 RepID=A0ACB8TCJ6_9AGAM|nr:hypothetical protein BV25DRAFT_1618463 [Artomyces pyxidatus]
MAYSHYRHQGHRWGSQQFRFGAPPPLRFEPTESWTGMHYYTAHAGEPDPTLYESVIARTGSAMGVGLHEARHWHRLTYGGLGELSRLSPAEIGYAAAYEAYRWTIHHVPIYEPLGEDDQRRREALVALAIAESSNLWREAGRMRDPYGLQAAAEAAGATASLICSQSRDFEELGGSYYSTRGRSVAAYSDAYAEDDAMLLRRAGRPRRSYSAGGRRGGSDYGEASPYMGRGSDYGGASPYIGRGSEYGGGGGAPPNLGRGSDYGGASPYLGRGAELGGRMSGLSGVGGEGMVGNAVPQVYRAGREREGYGGVGGFAPAGGPSMAQSLGIGRPGAGYGVSGIGGAGGVGMMGGYGMGGYGPGGGAGANGGGFGQQEYGGYGQGVGAGAYGAGPTGAYPADAGGVGAGGMYGQQGYGGYGEGAGTYGAGPGAYGAGVGGVATAGYGGGVPSPTIVIKHASRRHRHGRHRRRQTSGYDSY